MDFNLKTDIEFIKSLLFNQYGLQIKGIKPVSYAYQELARATSVGKTIFFGCLSVNAASFQAHATLLSMRAAYTKWNGAARYQLLNGSALISDRQLFDDIAVNSNDLSGTSDFDGGGAPAGETSIKQQLAGGNKLPWLTFIGYEINIQ